MNDLLQQQIMCGAGSDILPADNKSACPDLGLSPVLLGRGRG